jgi:hypothetical protein
MIDAVWVTPISRKSRLFAIAAAWQLAPWFPDAVLRDALQRAELFADGEIAGGTLDKWRQKVQRIERPLPRYAAELMPPSDACGAVRSACQVNPSGRFFYACSPLLYPNETCGTAFVERGPSLVLHLIRDIFGNPFRPLAFSPAWPTDTAVTLARQMYESRNFSAMPILADALQDAGCDNDDVLNHCRGPGPHVRGCWVVDLVLGKE